EALRQARRGSRRPHAARAPAPFSRGLRADPHDARDTTMTAFTPFHPQHETLADDASRYVDVQSIAWKPTPTPGIEMKVLMQDDASGLLTALFRWEPGTQLPLHEHVEIEQTYVLQGSIVDEEGEVREGNYVWRPKGNRHL